MWHSTLWGMCQDYVCHNKNCSKQVCELNILHQISWSRSTAPIWDIITGIHWESYGNNHLSSQYMTIWFLGILMITIIGDKCNEDYMNSLNNPRVFKAAIISSWGYQRATCPVKKFLFFSPRKTRSCLNLNLCFYILKLWLNTSIDCHAFWCEVIL